MPGDHVEPVAEHGSAGESACLEDEHEESGLERLLRIGFIAEEAPAKPEDHRSMPFEKERERRFVAVGQEPVEEMPVSGGGVLGAHPLKEQLHAHAETPGRPGWTIGLEGQFSW